MQTPTNTVLQVKLGLKELSLPHPKLCGGTVLTALTSYQSLKVIHISSTDENGDPYTEETTVECWQPGPLAYLHHVAQLEQVHIAYDVAETLPKFEQMLRALPSRIKFLQINNDVTPWLPTLTNLGCLSNLSQLTHLDLGNHLGELSSLQPLSELTSLQSLEIGSWENMPSLHPIGSLVHLTYLYLSRVQKPVSFSFCGSLPCLKELSIDVHSEQDDLEQITQLTSLLLLEIYNQHNMTFLSALAGLTDLTCLMLFEHPEQHGALPGLSVLTQLQSFHYSTGTWQDYEQVTCLQRLTELVLSTRAADSLQFVTSLRGLKRLEAAVCKLTTPPDLCQLQGLTTLKLEAAGLSDVQPLLCLSKLQELDIQFQAFSFPTSTAPGPDNTCDEIMGQVGRLHHLFVLRLCNLPVVRLALLNNLTDLCCLEVTQVWSVEFEQCTLQWDTISELCFDNSTLHNPPAYVSSVVQIREKARWSDSE